VLNAITVKVKESRSKEHDIVFSRGYLNPKNISADAKGNITGIVEWESAGWFPEYWEYTKAHFSVQYVIRWLTDVVDQVFEDY